jgi:hypothetical protein
MPALDIDQKCHGLAKTILTGYRLTMDERAQETERLAQALRTVVDAELEALEHRRIA